MAGGVAVSAWQAVRATNAEREQIRLRQVAEAGQKKAAMEAQKSSQVAALLKEMLLSAGPQVALGQDTTLLRGILDRTAEQVNSYLTNQPEVQAELLSLSGEVYENIGERKRSVTAFRQALAIQRRVLGTKSPALANTLAGLANALDGEGGSPPEAEACYREALQIWESYGSENWMVAGCLNNLTTPLRVQQKFAEAESVSRRALAMKQRLVAKNLADLSSETNADVALKRKEQFLSRADDEIAVSLRDLGLVLRSGGKLAEAEQSIREGLAIIAEPTKHALQTSKNEWLVVDEQHACFFGEGHWSETPSIRRRKRRTAFASNNGSCAA
jgi:tetratricopeptide (TPR) repeat protein